MNVYLYLLEGLAEWEISYILAELNSGRFFSDKNNTVEICKVASSMNPIKTMGGIKITPDLLLENASIKKEDIIILPGSDNWLEKQNLQIMNIIIELLNIGCTVGAICGATSALAESGILNNRNHTSNGLEYLTMVSKNYKGKKNYLNKHVVTDKNLITAGGLSPLEFSFEIFKSTNLFKLKTLESWYKLFKTNNPKYFYQLIESLS